MAIIDRVYGPCTSVGIGHDVVVVYIGPPFPSSLVCRDHARAKAVARFLRHGEEALREALRTLEGEGYAEHSTTIRLIKAALGDGDAP